MPENADVRHGRALRDRRVYLDHRDDGVTWFGVLMSTEDAVAAYQHADDQAKRLQQHPNECRTRAPIHSDLCSEWLRGVGTPSAAQTKVFLTTPVQLLTGGDVAATLPDPETMLPEPQAELVGHGPIDSLTAWACGGKTNIDELRPLCRATM